MLLQKFPLTSSCSTIIKKLQFFVLNSFKGAGELRKNHFVTVAIMSPFVLSGIGTSVLAQPKKPTPPKASEKINLDSLHEVIGKVEVEDEKARDAQTPEYDSRIKWSTKSTAKAAERASATIVQALIDQFDLKDKDELDHMVKRDNILVFLEPKLDANELGPFVWFTHKLKRGRKSYLRVIYPTNYKATVGTKDLNYGPDSLPKFLAEGSAPNKATYTSYVTGFEPDGDDLLISATFTELKTKSSAPSQPQKETAAAISWGALPGNSGSFAIKIANTEEVKALNLPKAKKLSIVQDTSGSLKTDDYEIEKVDSADDELTVTLKKSPLSSSATANGTANPKIKTISDSSASTGAQPELGDSYSDQRTLPVDIDFPGPPKISYSVGVLRSTLKDDAVRLVPDASDATGTKSIVTAGASSDATLRGVALIHFTMLKRGDHLFGPTLGIVSGSNKSYFLGGSWLYGKSQRVGLTLGRQYSSVKRLSGFSLGDSVPNAAAITESVNRRSGWEIAFTYAFGGGTKTLQPETAKAKTDDSKAGSDGDSSKKE